MCEDGIFRQLLDWGRGSICPSCIYAETCKNAHEACVECNRFFAKAADAHGGCGGDEEA